MEDHIDRVEMVRNRYEYQANLSKKKGHTSVDQFLPGDRVVIQDNSSGKWLEEGVIEQSRQLMITVFNPTKLGWKMAP